MQKHIVLMWTARIGGLIWLVLFGLFLWRTGLLAMSDSAVPSQFRIVIIFATIGFVGYLRALGQPTRGGRLLMAASLLLAGFFLYESEIAKAISWGLPPLLVGLCFMAADNRWLV